MHRGSLPHFKWNRRRLQYITCAIIAITISRTCFAFFQIVIDALIVLQIVLICLYEAAVRIRKKR